MYKLLTVGKGTRGGICHTVFQSTKDGNNYLKNYDKNKDSYVSFIWIKTICMVGQLHKIFCGLI